MSWDYIKNGHMKLNEIKKVHFIGIGGIGMSGLARLLLGEGKEVSGSDKTASAITEALEIEGVKFYGVQSKDNFDYSDSGALPDLVVYTEAMAKDHEELQQARALNIKTINYFDALGMIANEYYLIAVAGSHGKTTTTAMLIDIFEEAGLDPSAIVGSLRSKTKSNYRRGKSKYFIVEACEYKRDFLSLQPDILVITNLEHEHVDYYKNLKEVQLAFRELALKVPMEGFVIANIGDKNLDPVLTGLEATVVDYSKNFNPLRTLTVPGMHNQMNAAGAVAASLQVGINLETVERALENFAGTWRRFEFKGEVNGAKIYDDYGHHPTEIRATIQGARELYSSKKITLVFEPHTYSRTNELFVDFASALSLADRVILLPIYAAREQNSSGVTHTKLAEAVNAISPRAEAVGDFQTAINSIKLSLSESDLVLVMGAGTVTQIATRLVESK